jgi:hypothetical protein
MGSLHCWVGTTVPPRGSASELPISEAPPSAELPALEDKLKLTLPELGDELAFAFAFEFERGHVGLPIDEPLSALSATAVATHCRRSCASSRLIAASESCSSIAAAAGAAGAAVPLSVGCAASPPVLVLVRRRETRARRWSRSASLCGRPILR